MSGSALSPAYFSNQRASFLNPIRFLACLWLLLCAQYIFAEDLVPLKIVLNTQDKGEYFVLLKSNEDVWINEADFQPLGIINRGFSQNIDGVNYISLNDLKDQLEYFVDEKSLSIFININPTFLQKTEVDLSQKTVIRSNPFGIDSAFLNYAFVNRGSNREVLQTFETPLEGVISAHDMLLQTNFTHRREYIDGVLVRADWSRGITNITRDLPEKLNRFIMGDVPAISGELGGSGVFLGVSYRKKFNMATYFTKYPSVSVGGVLNTPSRINMYANGVLVRSEVLPPGEFTISNLPNLYGAGNLEMETIDAFGRVTTREISYYVSTRLLRVGLNDFMYTAGFKRDSLTARQPKYESQPSVLGYHRYGFTRYLTGGYRFEYADQLKNLGVSANMLIGSIGEAEAGFSFSQNSSNVGTAKYFRYGFTSRYFHGRYSYKQRSRDYSTISSAEVPNITDPIQSIGFGIHGLKAGSISLGYDVTGNFSQPRNRLYSVIYTLRVAKQASLLIRGTRTEDLNGVRRDAFVVTLSAALGRKVSASANYGKDDGDIKSSAYVQKSLPVGTGFGGRLRIDRTEAVSGKVTNLGDASLKIKTKYFSAGGDYFMGEVEDHFQTQFAGALAFVDNDFYLTRPIQDSFGLAKVDNLDDVRVYFSNELVGTTQNGRLIVPNLVSYADNHISIEGQDVPVDRALKNTNTRLSPKFRTGSVASFDVEKFQGFFGYIFLQRGNKRKTADFASLTLQNSQESYNTVVGKGGEFYLENLAAGSYRAQTKLDGEICHFNVDIPETKSMMVELGNYDCHM